MNKEEKEARQLCAYSRRLSNCKACYLVLSINPFDCNEWRLYLEKYRRTRLQTVKDIFEVLLKHG